MFSFFPLAVPNLQTVKLARFEEVRCFISAQIRAQVWSCLQREKKNRGLSGNKGRFHLCNLFSAQQNRRHQSLRAWEGACPACALDPSLSGLKTTLIQRCCWVMAHLKGFGVRCALALRPTEGRNLGQCPRAGLSPLPAFSKGRTCLLGIPPLASSPRYRAPPPPWAQGSPHWTCKSHFKPGRGAQSQRLRPSPVQCSRLGAALFCSPSRVMHAPEISGPLAFKNGLYAVAGLSEG